MTEPNLPDAEWILRAVQSWPRDRQLWLVRRLLDPRRETLDLTAHRPVISSASLRGLLAGHRLAASNEDIDHWREEMYD